MNYKVFGDTLSTRVYEELIKRDISIEYSRKFGTMHGYLQLFLKLDNIDDEQQGAASINFRKRAIGVLHPQNFKDPNKLIWHEVRHIEQKDEFYIEHGYHKRDTGLFPCILWICSYLWNSIKLIPRGYVETKFKFPHFIKFCKDVLTYIYDNNKYELDAIEKENNWKLL